LECRAEFSDGFPKRIDRSCFGFSQQGLHFGEHLFDGVEVGRAGREEQEPGTCVTDHAPDAVALVAVEVAHDDNVARLQCGHEDLGHVGFEAHAVDGAVNDARSAQAITTQRCEEGQRLPMPMRQLGFERQTASAPATQPRHVGLDPGLVDEDQARRVNPALILLPPVPPSGNVRPVLFAWQNGFF
jgi:hypothetical protein